MPDARLANARATLPEGYQFGDGHVTHPAFAGLGRDRALALVRSLREAKATAAAFVDAYEERTGFPFTLQGIADRIDAQALAEVYGRPIRGYRCVVHDWLSILRPCPQCTKETNV